MVLILSSLVTARLIENKKKSQKLKKKKMKCIIRLKKGQDIHYSL